MIVIHTWNIRQPWKRWHAFVCDYMYSYTKQNISRSEDKVITSSRDQGLRIRSPSLVNSCLPVFVFFRVCSDLLFKPSTTYSWVPSFYHSARLGSVFVRQSRAFNEQVTHYRRGSCGTNFAHECCSLVLLSPEVLWTWMKLLVRWRLRTSSFQDKEKVNVSWKLQYVYKTGTT